MEPSEEAKLSFSGPIGVFDSGYGGLSILRRIRERLPRYDYLYLGDNARAPYGPRSFDVVYRFTLEAVRYLFGRGCPLVILACNTSSAKALRSIQRNDLPLIDPTRRVLGVIRPTVEKVGEMSSTGVVGVMGTNGTVRSRSYDMEIGKLYPSFTTVSQECPMLVPLVERRRYVPEGARVVTQGEIVADSLADYLDRHPEMERRCTRGGSTTCLTTENPESFSRLARIFLGEEISANHIDLV